MRGNTHRVSRTNSDVQRVLSHIISYEIKDPRVGIMTTVTKVDVTKDLKECKCYISVLGKQDEEKDTMAGLESAKGFIRKQLAATLNLRNTPEIIFIADHSIAYGVEMTHRIDEIMENSRSEEDSEEEDSSLENE